jgi:hypothetical protein
MQERSKCLKKKPPKPFTGLTSHISKFPNKNHMNFNKNFRLLNNSNESSFSNQTTTGHLESLEIDQSPTDIPFGASFKLYMNNLIQYPKKCPLNYLVTFRDFTSDRFGPAESALFTSFGFETEFFTKLVEFAKVTHL